MILEEIKRDYLERMNNIQSAIDNLDGNTVIYGDTYDNIDEILNFRLGKSNVDCVYRITILSLHKRLQTMQPLIIPSIHWYKKVELGVYRNLSGRLRLSIEESKWGSMKLSDFCSTTSIQQRFLSGQEYKETLSVILKKLVDAISQGSGILAKSDFGEFQDHHRIWYYYDYYGKAIEPEPGSENIVKTEEALGWILDYINL